MHVVRHMFMKLRVLAGTRVLVIRSINNKMCGREYNNGLRAAVDHPYVSLQPSFLTSKITLQLGR